MGPTNDATRSALDCETLHIRIKKLQISNPQQTLDKPKVIDMLADMSAALSAALDSGSWLNFTWRCIRLAPDS